MRVLYLGESSPASTSRHRADALRRIGCEVVHLNPRDAIAHRDLGLLGALHYRTGYVFTRALVEGWLSQSLPGLGRFDVCWVDSGEYLGPKALDMLRPQCPRIVLFNHDDPTGRRDWLRFRTLRSALPCYDLCLVVRDFNVPEFKQYGARDVMHIWRGYDEVAHRPHDLSRPVAPMYDNEVSFIGRQFDGEGRDLLMMTLVEAGLKPAIWGDNWSRSRYWRELQPFWKGGSLSGQDYVDALRGARLCLGMLSKGNRDLHTTRSMEIPAAGGLLCAERTSEHQALYRENEEAVFWRDARECADVCVRLLKDPVERERIRRGGVARVLANKVGNEDIGRAALRRLGVMHE